MKIQRIHNCYFSLFKPQVPAVGGDLWFEIFALFDLYGSKAKLCFKRLFVDQVFHVFFEQFESFFYGEILGDDARDGRVQQVAVVY